jgi:hypothetical protein
VFHCFRAFNDKPESVCTVSTGSSFAFNKALKSISTEISKTSDEGQQLGLHLCLINLLFLGCDVFYHFIDVNGDCMYM